MNKPIGKKRSFFWETKEIDKNECPPKRERLNSNFFTKFCKKLFGQCESQLSKKKSSASFEPFRTKNNTANFNRHRNSLIDNYYIRPKPSLSILDNNLSEWKTELLQELDATQHKCGNAYPSSQHSQDLFRQDDHSVYSHDPVHYIVPPSAIHKNQRESFHNRPFPQEYITTDPRLTSTIRSVCSSNASSNSSTESQRHDRVKEKLEVAAARRNEIRNNRLREQMDSALFETMRMLRQEQYEQYQRQGGPYYKGKRVHSNSMSSDHRLAINQMDSHQRQPSNEDEQILM